MVNIWNTEQQGQSIGLSGNTGYKAFPHFHFQVLDKNNNEILVNCLIKKGLFILDLQEYRKK